MENVNTVANKQYSKLQYSKVNNINYSTVNNSTVDSKYDSSYSLELFNNLSDVIPKDGYYPFYKKMLNQLGSARFIELANKARAGSDTPAKLFCWMLKNNEVVR